MQEASDSQTWLDFCLACGYINKEKYAQLDLEYEKIMGKLNRMQIKADKFCFPKQM